MSPCISFNLHVQLHHTGVLESEPANAPSQALLYFTEPWCLHIHQATAATIKWSDWLSAQLLHHLPGLCISSALEIFKGLPHSKVLKTHAILVLSLFVSGFVHIIQQVDTLVGLLWHDGYYGINLKRHFAAIEPKGVQKKGIVHFCFISRITNLLQA